MVVCRSLARADSQTSPVVPTTIRLGSPRNLDLLNDMTANRSGVTVGDVNRDVTTPIVCRVGVLPLRRRPPGLLHEPVKRISVSKIAASVRLIPIWRPWNILILLKENTMASRRNDNGNQTSQSDLLRPLPPEERPATIGPDDVRKLVASVDELKTLIVERSGPDESNNAAIQEAMNGILGVIEVFMNRQRERSEADSSSLAHLQEALTSNQETLAGFLSELVKADGKSGSAVAEALAPIFRDFGILQEGFKKLQEEHAGLQKSHSESINGIAETLGEAQGRPAPAAVSLDALDRWRDDCIKRFEVVVAKARAEETASETRLLTGEFKAELDRIDRVSSRISSLEQTYETESRVSREFLSGLKAASQETGEKVAAQGKIITELNYTVPRDIARIRSAIKHLQIKWRVFLSPLALAIAIILGMVFETKSNFLFWLFQ